MFAFKVPWQIVREEDTFSIWNLYVSEQILVECEISLEDVEDMCKWGAVTLCYKNKNGKLVGGIQ